MSVTHPSCESPATSGHNSRVGVNLATFDELADARELCDLMNAHGFGVWIQDERRLQKYWYRATPNAGLHLRIAEPEMVEAQSFLKDNRAAVEFLSKAVHCPSCSSTRIEYPAITRKNILPAMLAQIAVAVGILSHENYCENCHFTWRRNFRVKRSTPLAES
jgi:predicted Zn-ribbon and HTH transcriptional regulator